MCDSGRVFTLLGFDLILTFGEMIIMIRSWCSADRSGHPFRCYKCRRHDKPGQKQDQSQHVINCHCELAQLSVGYAMVKMMSLHRNPGLIVSIIPWWIKEGLERLLPDVYQTTFLNIYQMNIFLMRNQITSWKDCCSGSATESFPLKQFHRWEFQGML